MRRGHLPDGVGKRPRRMFHPRSEEHTSELQPPCNLVCRLLLGKKTSQSCLGYNGSNKTVLSRPTDQTCPPSHPFVPGGHERGSGSARLIPTNQIISTHWSGTSP